VRAAFVLMLWGENQLHLQRMNFICGFYEKVSCYDGFGGICCCRVRRQLIGLGWAE
jgi:hypothetical protein